MKLDEHDREDDPRDGEIRGFGADFGWMLTVEVPVGELCHVCQAEITTLDVGHTMIRVAGDISRVAVHRQCFLSSIGLKDKEEAGYAGTD